MCWGLLCELQALRDEVRRMGEQELKEVIRRAGIVDAVPAMNRSVLLGRKCESKARRDVSIIRTPRAWDDLVAGQVVNAGLTILVVGRIVEVVAQADIEREHGR